MCCTVHVESNNNNSILYFCCSNRQLHRLIARLQMILLIILSCPKIKTIHVLQLLIKKQLLHHPVHQYHNSKTTVQIQNELEYTDVYEANEEYDGPPYASQPMITGKHGASYTPPGWKRKRVKRAKLYLTPSEHTESEKSDGSASSHYDW